MKRKGLLHLLCATMLLAIAIVYLPSCSNDEEDAEYWMVTLEDHYAPYQYDLENTNMLPKSIFGIMKKVMSMYYVLKRLQHFNR